MAITRESAREMSDEALADALRKVATAKHSEYLDERLAVIEALIARPYWRQVHIITGARGD